ncbi:hydroxyacylglutathione hydrolase [Snodgrassella sp. CFCC 13594]|uniref:hydroxyacylglutathione hydrolase n=1 Tax=Snodgrassella sp. CFCC 13594 TaxID=1775559 RepID=UPI00082EFF6A|nr:hydroxyacylglutathione hydrolase [Snodgrassella sp. CFCC 13594]
MTIMPIHAFEDNYIWLLRHNDEAICVDPGEAAPLMAYLEQHHLSLKAIWLTHAHADHIGGVAALREAWPDVVVYGNGAWPGVCCAVDEGDELRAWDAVATVWAVPGHTLDHLAYVLSNGSEIRVFCGDTLFSGGCGRVFSGTITDLYHSITRLNTLPAHTLFYPAHEYTLANLIFAAAVEPGNEHIQQAQQQAQQLRRQHRPTLPVTLAHEREINPFLRTHAATVAAAAVRTGLDKASATQSLAVFACLREWKNRFSSR